VSRRRMGRVLTQAGLRCKTQRTFRPPRNSGQAQTVAPNRPSANIHAKFQVATWKVQ